MDILVKHYLLQRKIKVCVESDDKKWIQQTTVISVT